MGAVLFITGAITSGALCYFYFSNKNKALGKELYEVNQKNIQIQKIKSQELEDLENELKLKSGELRKIQDKNDSTEDRFDDLDFEVSKLKKANQSLIDENEKLTSTVKEYEMLYKVKKDEIEKMKNQLNK